MGKGGSLAGLWRYLESGLADRCVPVAELVAARARGALDVEEAFFAHLRLRNRIYKTSGAHRFDDTFELITRHIAPSPGAASRSPQPPCDVLDVACSSGVSTVELHRALTAAGLSCRTVGTDALLSARLVRRADGAALLFDDGEQVLQVDWQGWAMSWVWPPSKKDRALSPWRVARARRLMTREVDEFRAALRGPVPGMHVQEISLLSCALEGTRDVEFRQEDLLHPHDPGATFDLVRAANILNHYFFAPDTLRSMVQAVARRVADGGLLFVVRESDGVNRGGLYRRVGSRLQVLEEQNGGSEIAGLLEELDFGKEPAP